MGAPVSNALKTSRKRNTSGTLKASGIPKISSFGDANSLLLFIDGVVDYAICMLDPEGRILSWNSGAVRLKGYTPNEIIGESFSRFYTPEDLQAGVPGSAPDSPRDRALHCRRVAGLKRRHAFLGHGCDRRHSR